MAKILIIDDDAAFGELVADLLRPSGHETFAVTSGREGLALVKLRLRPDLVLVDLNMERMSGFQTVAALRTEPACNSSVIVMLTATSSDQAALEARRQGAQGFLSKPIRAPVLGQQVKRLIEDGRLVWIDDHHSVSRAA